jgi:hypothetical protein
LLTGVEVVSQMAFERGDRRGNRLMALAAPGGFEGPAGRVVDGGERDGPGAEPRPLLEDQADQLASVVDNAPVVTLSPPEVT